MTTLDRKLLRDLRRLWAQSLAIALVLAAGVTIVVLAFGAQRSLHETREAYYERHRFADVFASARRAPDGLIAELQALPGVTGVETRVSGHAVLDVPGLDEPALGRVLSLPRAGEPVVNLPFLRAGRLPDPLRADEVAISEAFAEANGLRPGDGFAAILNGQRRELTITGLALSPEFIYTIGPGALMPDDRRFGVLWISHDTAAGAFDLRGAFNDVALKLARGTAEAPVLAAVDALLAPYGGTGAYGRDQQVSHAFLDNELVQLRVTSYILPPVFFVISAFLVNMVLARLIALERARIGLFKALGYSDAAVAWHYLKLALAIGATGVLVGWALGWWAGQGMTRLYSQFFRFPYLVYVTSFDTFAVSALAGLATVAAGALGGVRSAASLAPAVAMAPPRPVRYRRLPLDRLTAVLGLPTSARMILRSLTRWPGRALGTTLGVSAAVATLIASLFVTDAVEFLIDASLFQANRQDATLNLTEARPRAAITEVAGLPGVLTAEGVHAVPVRIHNGPRSEPAVLEGRPPDATLARVLDMDGRPVTIPDSGLLISDKLAALLDLTPGQTVEVELMQDTRETHSVPVAGVVRLWFGDGVYMDADALATLLRMAPRINVAHLALDPAAVPALNAAVKITPGIAGMILWTEVRRSFRETMGQNLGIQTAIYTALGGLIAVGVVYNAARIQLSERAHELASLRVLGFTRGEVSAVLVGELMLLTLLGIPFGWLFGHGFAALVAWGYSSDMISLPLVVSRATVAYASLIVFLAALASALVVRRRIDRLDLVAVLKVQD
jgi:putative ABC transport system permease protein